MEIDGCPLPDDRRYDVEHHVWVKPEGDGRTGRLGFTAPFASFIGLVSAVTYRPAAPSLERGQSVGLVESIRFTGAVRMPVAGRVLETNARLLARPRWINDDPYGEGWVARIEAGAPLADEPRLESVSAIHARLVDFVQRYRVRCWPQTPELTMHEIGLECSAILTKLNEELGRRPSGTAVLLVTDDPTSPIEMRRWADQTGHSLLAHRREGTLEEFLLRKEADPKPRVRRG